MTVDVLWNTYVMWFEYLEGWARMLASAGSAKRCARRAMGEMFLLALNGAETLDGPYMHSVDLLYKGLCMEPELHDHVFVASAFASMPYPDDHTLYHFCQLYAAVYEVGYIASLTITERENLAIRLRMFNPFRMDDRQIFRMIESEPADHSPLRRVLEMHREHTHDEEMICAAASALWEAEDGRSQRWLERATRENGVRT